MSKYNCIKCSKAAFVTDFTKDSQISAVYALCKVCGANAWGGLDFHPAMNEVFNLKFSPNYDFKISNDDMYRVIVLDK